MSEESKGALDGPTRAAIFLMAVGEQSSAEVLRHMRPHEVQSVGTAMSAISNVTQDRIGQVLDDFVADVANQSSLSLGSRDYLKSVLNRTIGEQMTDSVLPAIAGTVDSKGLETLKWMDPKVIAEVLRKEHPQLVAIVLVSMDSDDAGKVVDLFPEELQVDVMMRIATLDSVSASALRELDDLIAREFQGTSDVKVGDLGGPKKVAGLLNSVSTEAEEIIAKKLQEELPEMYENIQTEMFTFADLMQIDDRSVQMLLRDVQSDVLIVALRGADASAKAKIFRNMSSRAADMLKDDLESQGPVRLSEVEEAQKTIIQVARDMAEEGKLMLPGKGEDLV